LDETPRTSVKRFLLTPDNGFGVLVHVKILFELCPWEWIQLFNASNGCLVVSFFSSVLVQGGVHLSRTQDDSVNLVRFNDRFAMFWVRDNPLEVGITSKVFNVGACERVSQ
jgi:hypothetical protein